MKKHETIENAYKYIENAKSILKEKAQRTNGYYSKPKYVKMAGNTAWNGVLVALDLYMQKRGITKKGRKKKSRRVSRPYCKRKPKTSQSVSFGLQLFTSFYGIRWRLKCQNC